MYKIPTIFEGNLFEATKLVLSGERMNPVFYFPYWVVEMSKKIFGIMGDRSMFMKYEYLVPYFVYFFLSMYLLFKNRKKLKREEKGIIAVIFFYTLVVAYYVNYKAYILTDWRDLGLQGRYIFPVLAPMYIVFSKYFLKIKNSKLLNVLVGILIAVFLLGNYGYFFANAPTNWFVPESEFMIDSSEEERESMEFLSE